MYKQFHAVEFSKHKIVNDLPIFLQGVSNSLFPHVLLGLGLALSLSNLLTSTVCRLASFKQQPCCLHELDLFPLLEIASSDIILAQTSQGVDCQTVKITFRLLILTCTTLTSCF